MEWLILGLVSVLVFSNSSAREYLGGIVRFLFVAIFGLIILLTVLIVILRTTGF